MNNLKLDLPNFSDNFANISKSDQNVNSEDLLSPQAKKIQESFEKASKAWSKKVLDHKTHNLQFEHYADIDETGEVIFGYGKIKASSNKVKFYTIDTFYNEKIKSISGYSSLRAKIKKQHKEEKKDHVATESYQKEYLSQLRKELIEQMSFCITAIFRGERDFIDKNGPKKEKITLLCQRISRLQLNLLKPNEISPEVQEGLQSAIVTLNHHLKEVSFQFAYRVHCFTLQS